MIKKRIESLKKKLFGWVIKKNNSRRSDETSGIKNTTVGQGTYNMKNGVYKKNNKKVFKKKSGVVRKILKYIGYLLIASILLVLFAIFYLFMTLEIPSIDKIEKNRLAQSTKIYDRTGEFLLYDFHGDERRTSIKFKDISKNIVNATIAIEDKEFRNHNGIVVRSIVKAAYENIVAGKKVRGASTITQQVVKNYILTREKTYIRKIKEAVLALKLEKIKTKDEIMEMYLNEISYGGQVYGIEEAARVYFGKPAADLSVLESAYLAGIPNAPSIYSPYISGNRKRLENRKNLILRLLSEQGYISDKELDDAKSSEVTFLAIGESNNMRAPHFTNYVIAQLKKMYSAEELINSGFKVYTTLNWKMHKEIEDALAKEADRFKRYRATNAASVAIDSRNGEILSMVGSLDFYSKKIDGQTNIVLSRRQPGSTAKPFAYASLISQGYSPETLVWDVPTQFNLGCKPTAKNSGSCYMPLNYGGIMNINGPISLRNALIKSLNIPAVKVMYLAGIKEVNKLANDMGLNLLNNYNYYGLSFVLGGAEVRLLDLTSAYGIFGNDGVKNNIVSIIKIIDMDKEEVYHKNNTDKKSVLSKNTARVINDMLTSHSPSSNIYFPGKKVAVKTGTTNDYRDVWTVGYSRKVSMGMWAGNNNNKSMASNSSSVIIAPVWKKIMRIVNRYYTPETFPRASYQYAVKNKTMLNGQWKIENNENGYVTGHNILHYINKSNIKKNIVSKDKAYRNWEYGVQLWLNNHGFNKIKEVEENIEESHVDIDTNNDSHGAENLENNKQNTNNKADAVIVKGKEGKEKDSVNKRKPVLNVSTSNLKLLTRDEKINIKVNLKNSDIIKVNYYVNSKKVAGNSTSMVLNLSTFLGLRESNTIEVKVVDKSNRIYNRKFIFTMK